MVFYPGGTYRSESCDVALQQSGVLDHRLTQQRAEWRSAAPAHCKSIKQNNNLQQFRPQIEKKLQCWNRKINTGIRGQFYPVIPPPAHTLTSMTGLVQYKRRQLHTNTSDKEKYREQKQTFIHLFIYFKHFFVWLCDSLGPTFVLGHHRRVDAERFLKVHPQAAAAADRQANCTGSFRRVWGGRQTVGWRNRWAERRQCEQHSRHCTLKTTAGQFCDGNC